MIREDNPNQIPLPGFENPFDLQLDKNNRWVKLAQVIPWEKLSHYYHQTLSATVGRPATKARIVIGALIIKHKQGLSDEETVLQIIENPYLQYFIGLPAYSKKQIFVPSLFVEIRKRMGQEVFDGFYQVLVAEVENSPGDDKTDHQANDSNVEKVETTNISEQAEMATTQDDKAKTKQETKSDTTPKHETNVEQSKGEEKQAEEKQAPHAGKLIIDATVAPQAIRYPTDLSLLNEAREISEQLIDHLYQQLKKQEKEQEKPRTYRKKARSHYLSYIKRKRLVGKNRRKAIRGQLQYLKRNLKHITNLLDMLEKPSRYQLHIPKQLQLTASKQRLLSNKQRRHYWVIQQLYQQQQEMYDAKKQRCDNRIVSIHQPHVRPIVRGKQHPKVEFGTKLSASLDKHGLAHATHQRWDAFHEGQDLREQVEHYRKTHGYYPEVVLADPAYGTRINRRYLKQKGIRFGGKPLGRPKVETPENAAQLKQEKQQRRADYRQRIPIEGKFGQGKRGYGLDYIIAKTPQTSQAWINSIFFVMNLLVCLKQALFFALDYLTQFFVGLNLCWRKLYLDLGPFRKTYFVNSSRTLGF